jgi:hypothetical protein
VICGPLPDSLAPVTVDCAPEDEGDVVDWLPPADVKLPAARVSDEDEPPEGIAASYSVTKPVMTCDYRTHCMI